MDFDEMIKLEYDGKVLVLSWAYADGSGSGVVAVFGEPVSAGLFYNALVKHGDDCKVFELHEVELISSVNDCPF